MEGNTKGLLVRRSGVGRGGEGRREGRRLGVGGLWAWLAWATSCRRKNAPSAAPPRPILRQGREAGRSSLRHLRAGGKQPVCRSEPGGRPGLEARLGRVTVFEMGITARPSQSEVRGFTYGVPYGITPLSCSKTGTQHRQENCVTAFFFFGGGGNTLRQPPSTYRQCISCCKSLPCPQGGIAAMETSHFPPPPPSS